MKIEEIEKAIAREKKNMESGLAKMQEELEKSGIAKKPENLEGKPSERETMTDGEN